MSAVEEANLQVDVIVEVGIAGHRDATHTALCSAHPAARCRGSESGGDRVRFEKRKVELGTDPPAQGPCLQCLDSLDTVWIDRQESFFSSSEDSRNEMGFIV